MFLFKMSLLDEYFQIFTKFFLFSRCRIGPAGENALISSSPNGLALDFERSDSARRLRLFLSELLSVMAQVNLKKK